MGITRADAALKWEDQMEDLTTEDTESTEEEAMLELPFPCSLWSLWSLW